MINYAVLGSLYTCDIQNEIASDGTEEITSVTGAHLTGKEDASVNGIVTTKALNYFPSGFEKKFENIFGISLYAKVISIKQSDLKPFKKLRYINIQNSEIKSLNAALFAANPLMEVVSFTKNMITFVGKGLLDSLTKLSYVDFRENRCIDKFAQLQFDITALKFELNSNCVPSKDVCGDEETTELKNELNKLKAQMEFLKEEIWCNTMRLASCKAGISSAHLDECNEICGKSDP